MFFEMIWFWLLAASFVLFIISEATESGVMSFMVFVGTVVGLQLTGVDLLAFSQANYQTVLLGIIFYFVIGVLWSLYKWFAFNQDEKIRYTEMRATFFRTYKKNYTNSPEVEDAWKDEIKFKKFPPKLEDNKARIIRWMTCWVTSVIWTICCDFITGIFRRLFALSKAVFQGISNKMFAEFKKDFE